LSYKRNPFSAILFRRGESTRQETLVTWGGWRWRPISFTNYERVVVYIKFKPQAYFDERRRRQSPDQEEDGALSPRRGGHHALLVSRLWGPQALFNGPYLVV
jgi:hypothetical protein